MDTRKLLVDNKFESSNGVLPYIGSGPYCYSNSLVMMLGEHAPAPAVVEVLTASPFGMVLLAGRTPFFDPYGWTPEIGMDLAMSLLGWTCRRESGGTGDEAAQRLRRALARGPVLVGPVEIGLLRYHPDMHGPIGSDHYVVALGIEGDRVLLHDPHGYPFTAFPLPELLAAWRADSLDYGTSYTLRYDFAREREVGIEQALRGVLPEAIAFLSNRDDHPVPDGTVGAGVAAHALADLLSSDPDPDLIGHLTYFAVRVGARRLSDAATMLGALGLDQAADTAAEQARLVGSLQYDLVTGDFATAARTLRELAPSYERLAHALS
ncbi:BtrH N-terminal domain-containing protein [Nocardia terpenica]